MAHSDGNIDTRERGTRPLGTTKSYRISFRVTCGRELDSSDPREVRGRVVTDEPHQTVKVMSYTSMVQRSKTKQKKGKLDIRSNLFVISAQHSSAVK